MPSQWPLEASREVDASVTPSLLELSVRKFSKHYQEYESFRGVLPRDVIQLVLNNIVRREQRVSPGAFRAFSNCLLEVFQLADCTGVDDSLMPIVASQGQSLLRLDISNSGVTDDGLTLLEACGSMESLTLNGCQGISDRGLSVLRSFSNLNTLSLRGCSRLITPKGMRHFSHLTQLRTLDLQGCENTLGGLHHIRGLTSLLKLNVGWRVLGVTKEIRKKWVSDVKNIGGLMNLAELHISWNYAQPTYILPLKGLKLESLYMEGCYLDDEAFALICGMTDLRCLDIRQAIQLPNGYQKIGGLVNLRTLDIGWTPSDFTGFLRGLVNLRLLDISSTHVRNDGLRLLSGLTKLESLNIGNTGGAPFDDLCAITTITSLRYLNVNSKEISDAALLSLVALTGLVSLELFDAKIMNVDMSYLHHFRNLQTLDLRLCAISDAGLREIAPLTSLTFLDISQNELLTDDALKHLSGMRLLMTLKLASTSITSNGLQHHLTLFMRLRSLTV